MIDKITHNGEIIAIIIPSEYKSDGITFFTPDNFSQQLAYMNRPAGYEIEPHVHNKIERVSYYTQEALFIRKGKVKVDFFTKDRKHLESRVIKTGDVIFLASGGHGFTMIEPTEIIEIKQGPYAKDKDKEKISFNNEK